MDALTQFLHLHPETLSRALVGLGAIIGASMPLLAAFLAKIRIKSDIAKDESMVIESALKNEANDLPYQEFLRDIAKERALGILFGVPVRTAHIGALMKLHKTGRVTTEEIRKVWPYMTIKGTEVTFLAHWDDWVQFVLASAGLVLGLLIVALNSLIFILSHGKDKESYAAFASALIGFVFIIGFALMTQGVFIAYALRKQFKSV